MWVGAAGLVLGAIAFTTPAAAQGINAQCAPGTVTGGIPNQQAAVQDACQKAMDLFQYMAPQLGVTIAGGNATIGVGGTIGGLGHIYLSGRANVVQSDLPQVDQVTPSVTGAQRSTYPTRSQIIGIPEADASIGIFRGIPVGLTNVGGLDLLVSATYLPAFSSGSLDVRVPNGSLKLGAGARLGLIQETPFLPGVAVTYLRRGLPTVDLVATTGSDTLRVSDVNVTTDAVRLVISKNLFLFGLAAGVGEDRYDSRASVSAYVASRGLGGALVSPASTAGPYSMKQTLNRTTYFVDGSVNLALVRLIGEIGHTTANTIPTYNSFSGSPAGAARTYGAIGLRLGI
jgi:hypothetical protein